VVETPMRKLPTHHRTRALFEQSETLHRQVADEIARSRQLRAQSQALLDRMLDRSVLDRSSKRDEQARA